MLEYQVNPNVKLVIRVQLGSSDTGLFPQTIVYDEDDGSVVDTVNLTHKASGLYVGDWTNDGQRKRYYTQTIIYTDSYGGTESPIDRPDSDSINVGFLNAGGVFGSAKGGKTVVRKELTKEEINKIVKGVVDELTPLIEERSNFNPETDIVKTGIELDITPILDKIDDVKNNMGDKDMLIGQNKLNTSVIKLVDNIVNANKETKKFINNYVLKLEDKIEVGSKEIKNIINEHNLELDQSVLNKVDEVMSRDVHIENTKSISNLRNKLEQYNTNLKHVQQLTEKVNLFAGGMTYGKMINDNKKEPTQEKPKQAEIEQDGISDLINALNSNSPAIEIYNKLKGLDQNAKGNMLELIRTKYPSIFKKLLKIIK